MAFIGALADIVEMGELGAIEAEADAMEVEPLLGNRAGPVDNPGTTSQLIGGSSFAGGFGLQATLQHYAGKALERDAARMGKVPRPPSVLVKKSMGKQRPRSVTLSPEQNLRRRINTGGATMSSKRSGADGDEVAVVPPPRKISKIHPDYFTITLPYIRRFQSLLASGFVYTSSQPLATIRLNSIYDPFKAVRATLGNPISNADTQPQGRDIWAAHFKYYRVLQARVKVSYFSESLANTTQNDPMYNTFAVGYELTDEDGPISNNAEMFMTTKRAKRDLLLPALTNHVWNGTSVLNQVSRPSTMTHVYHYNPGDWQYHVEEKGSEERWTPIGANPSIDHEFHIRCMHMDSGNAPDGRITVMVQIEYDVQFREATDSFFKTQITATAGYPDAEGEADD